MKSHPFMSRATFATITILGLTLSNVSATEETGDEPRSVLDRAGFDTELPTSVKKVFREKKNTTSPTIKVKEINKDGQEVEVEKANPDFKASEFLPDQGHEFSIGVEGGIVQQFMGQGSDLTRGTLSVNVGYAIGPVALALKLTPEELISRALGDQFEKQGESYTNGVTTVYTKDIIERGVVTISLFRYVNPETGKEVFALAATVGRDNATPLGSFVMEGWPAVSILEDRSLAQLDQIKVSARFFENTMVEIVNFGYDWFGYSVDPLQDVNQEGNESWAVNVSHKFDKILGDKTALELYVSYANIDEGLTYTRAVTQPGPNDTYAAGARLTYKKFTLAAEGYMEQPNASSVEDRYGMSVQAGYWIGRIQPVVGVELVDQGDTSWIYSLGVNWQVLNNVIVSFLAQLPDTANGEDDPNFYLGIKVGQSLPQAMSIETRSER